MPHGSPKHAKIAATSSGDLVLVAGQAGSQITVTSCLIISDTLVTIKFTDEENDKTGPMTIAPNGGFSLDDNEEGWFICAIGDDLEINLSGDANVSGCLSYRFKTMIT